MFQMFLKNLLTRNLDEKKIIILFLRHFGQFQDLGTVKGTKKNTK